MPLYAFEVINPDTGEVVARFDVPLPVAQRDSLALRREQIPARVGFANGVDHPDSGNTMRVLHRVEQRMGNTEDFYRRIQFSPETYKKAWANHKATEE